MHGGQEDKSIAQKSCFPKIEGEKKRSKGFHLECLFLLKGRIHTFS
jgi:hypothetical protein